MKKTKIEPSKTGNKNYKNHPTPENSIIQTTVNNLFIKPDIWTSLFYLNLILAYICILLVISGHTMHKVYAFSYMALIYFIHLSRKSHAEKVRIETAHRIPFFTDALANALSVGSTLEKSLMQSCYYLKGEIKEEFEKLILKCSLGKDIGVLLRNIDAKFPNTGLRYLISLLEQYRELGVGISPLLKRISTTLVLKGEAEEKINAILSAGSSYARLAIGIFLALFGGLSYFFKDQMSYLVAPHLRSTFFFLIAWIIVGILVVTRITAIDFCKNFALRPQIKHYLQWRKMTTTELMKYSGISWTPSMENLFLFAPGISGFGFAYLSSWYIQSGVGIGMSFIFGALLCWKGCQSILKGMVEDQLIKTIEIFPDVLQVFIIGLNSGLNTYKAFEYAEKAVRGSGPKILSEELCRTKFAMECGENHSVTWQRFAEMLPFETVIDFSEIMVVAPMHGESIVQSIVQMAKSYESKKLLTIEKNAVIVGQIVIPIIVIAFLPLFLFVMFAPIIIKITDMLNR